ncbi:thermonuclease family protein [Nitrosomonas eutropha]|uniref:Endonuclease YncB(Thermonuclease family) n=2 Tax=Nitrosomonas eutropha TaxID=916 RepID=A0ABX5MBG9_9PROT|nr:thermonuclease family protein [Nitrosomonas eutropha]PXV82465.1 endonuclease YncB(thermonuclease family) [Nitrosomonas eutropha]
MDDKIKYRRNNFPLGALIYYRIHNHRSHCYSPCNDDRQNNSTAQSNIRNSYSNLHVGILDIFHTYLMNLKKILFLAIFIVALPLQAEQLTGRVVAISDGDTLTILDSSKKQIKIRMAGIDTPESKQPYGTKAKQELSDLAFGKTATIEVEATDRYKRKVGRVYVNRVNINAEMVKRGAAWVYPQYANDLLLYSLEHEARLNRRGLWKLPDNERVPPWLWRKNKFKQRKAG